MCHCLERMTGEQNCQVWSLWDAIFRSRRMPSHGPSMRSPDSQIEMGGVGITNAEGTLIGAQGKFTNSYVVKTSHIVMKLINM